MMPASLEHRPLTSFQAASGVLENLVAPITSAWESEPRWPLGPLGATDMPHLKSLIWANEALVPTLARRRAILPVVKSWLMSGLVEKGEMPTLCLLNMS